MCFKDFNIHLFNQFSKSLCDVDRIINYIFQKRVEEMLLSYFYEASITSLAKQRRKLWKKNIIHKSPTCT